MIEPRVIQRCQRIYERHREEVVLGRKTARELMDCAKEFLDFREIPPLEIYPRPLMRERAEMYQEYFARTAGLQGKTPDFAAFLVERNEKSEGYFQEAGLSGEDSLVILLELHSVNLACISQSLTSKLRRLGGIDPKDLAEKNLEFVCYILDSFLEDGEHPYNENNPCVSSVETVVTAFVPVVTDPEEDRPDTPQEARWRKLSLYGTGNNC